jgi:hypothetical protein
VVLQVKWEYCSRNNHWDPCWCWRWDFGYACNFATYLNLKTPEGGSDRLETPERQVERSGSKSCLIERVNLKKAIDEKRASSCHPKRTVRPPRFWSLGRRTRAGSQFLIAMGPRFLGQR